MRNPTTSLQRLLRNRPAVAGQRGGGVKRTVTILGSTGSVGVNTLRVIRCFPDIFRVKGLAAGVRGRELAEQAAEFKPEAVFLNDDVRLNGVRARLPRGTRVFTASDGLRAFAQSMDADILVAATSGTTGLLPVLDAIKNARQVALANKEILVMAGSLVMRALRNNPSAALIPVDSEHSAIFQCLRGSRPEEVRKLVLTSSGGPLRQVAQRDFNRLPKSVVVKHPKWRMGKKISVDSATLMNKGLEIIEASWLFGLPISRIEVLIHPEAVVHSMVEFRDGALLGQLGVTDMRLPIQYAMTYPHRLSAGPDLHLDWSKGMTLTFAAPDRRKFPCLDLAYEAAKASGSAPCVLSAADEIAVGAYLSDRIRFTQIPSVIEKVLSRHRFVADPDLKQIQSLHLWAAEEAERLCRVP